MRQWYVVRTKPKKDSFVADLLSRVDIDAYSPRVAVFRKPGKSPSEEPLFPGYVFTCLDAALGEIQLAKYTSGVLSIIGYGDEPCPVPDELIETIRSRTGRGRDRRSWSDYRQGDLVLITRGPFRDFEAVFDGHLSSSGRVQVLVKTLRRLWRADVHVSQLRLISKAVDTARAA